MSIFLNKSVNLGPSKGSLSTVGYRLYNTVGSLSGSRVTSGVGEILAGSGIYSASVYFATNFSGSILWDSGESSPVYATEEYRPTEEKIDFIHDIEGGMWKIDKDDSQMIFYKKDNATEIARFDLKDENDAASVESVFSRTRS